MKIIIYLIWSVAVYGVICPYLVSMQNDFAVVLGLLLAIGSVYAQIKVWRKL